MLDESASGIHSSLCASINSWFTPTILFVLLNLVIGTIALTSAITNNKKQSSQNEPNHPKINTSAPTSSVLQRLKSISFYTQSHPVQESQKFDQTHQPQIFETRSNYIFALGSLETPQVEEGECSLDTETHFVSGPKDPISSEAALEEKVEENDGFQSMDEVYCQFTTGDHFRRTKSDAEPSYGELPAKIRKSASLKSPFVHFVEEDIVETRRPATVRERGNVNVSEGDDEVDARADDFINKFKQQLKLQRLNSIVKYKEMVGKSFGGR